jgi:endonuclease YncB( thermonuclease family)
MKYKLVNVKAVDGDSVKATIKLGFGVALHSALMRLSGIDTPEIHTRNKIEKQSGRLVTQWLKGKIKSGKEFYFITSKKDRCKYGRPMGVLFIDGENICLGLVKQGFAISYHGKKKEKWTDKKLKSIINKLSELE